MWIPDVYRNKPATAPTVTKPTQGERLEKVYVDSQVLNSSSTYTSKTDFKTFDSLQQAYRPKIECVKLQICIYKDQMSPDYSPLPLLKASF